MLHLTHMTDILEKLMCGNARIKLMRLFLFNTQASFLHQDIAERSKVPTNKLKSEHSCTPTSLLVALVGNSAVFNNA